MNANSPSHTDAAIAPARAATHVGENLVEKVDNQWIGRAPYLEAVAVRGDGVFDTLKTVSKMVLKTLS